VPELTVASFNVHWGRGRRRAGCAPFDVVAVCRSLEADVVVLQESWAPDDGTAQHDEVAAALGHDVVAVSLSRSNAWPAPTITSRADPYRRTGTGDWCLAVLSGLPIRSHRTHPLRQLPTDPSSRVLVEATLDVHGSDLTLIATHFTHLEFGAPLHTAGLRRALPSGESAGVLVGDMNMWGWCIDAMTPKAWRRVVRGKTWPAHMPHSQIDHILVTPSVELVWADVLADVGSDHRPIRARLRVP
jgi:endonuclease/exonuclease/phosphatase family metal-dependent hydrolase